MVDFDIEYCPHCGEELDYKAETCPECGAFIPEDSSYCPNCGKELEHDYYECSRCDEEITEEQVETLNAMSYVERAKHVKELNRQFKEKQKGNELEAETRRKQRKAALEESHREQALLKNAEQVLVNDVETFLTDKVDIVKYVKPEPAKITTLFIKNGQTYKMTVLKENWETALLRLLNSIDSLPSDIKSYKIERL